MRYFFVFLFFIFFQNFLFSEEIKFEQLPYKKNIKEKILRGSVFSESVVADLKEKKEQKLNFSIAGLHPKSCTYALKTLSLYEEYNHYLSFVKESHYHPKKNEIDFLLSHFLLPYDMRLIFTLPRITKTGSYPFVFEIGILKNLHGTIFVSNHLDKCLFHTTAEWTGPHTGFPNMAFELFSQILSKLSMEMLFRISSNLKH